MNRLRRDDRGQITTVLVMVMTLAVVALGLWATKLGQATDQKSRVQIAADAAALAGAQEIRGKVTERQILGAMGASIGAPGAAGGGGSDGGLECGMGSVAASDFANRGGARLVSYCYYSETDTVEVSVDSLANSVSGSPAKASATATLGLAFNDCAVPRTPTPRPTPTPTAAVTPSPTPSDSEVQVRCGDVAIPLVFDGGGNVIRIALSESEIRELFTPALKS